MKITDEEIQHAVSISFTLSGVVRRLGRDPAMGGIRQYIKNKISILKLDVSHFKGQSWAKDKIINREAKTCSIYRRPIVLKMLRLNGTAYECSICKIKEWQGIELPLEIDHIDGDRSNNSKDNIRLLCPNCHSICATSSSSRSGKSHLWKRDVICLKDGSSCIQRLPHGNSETWKKFSLSHRKIERPDYEILKQDVENLGYLGTGRKYNVSNTTIKRWISHHEKYYKT